MKPKCDGRSAVLRRRKRHNKNPFLYLEMRSGGAGRKIVEGGISPTSASVSCRSLRLRIFLPPSPRCGKQQSPLGQDVPLNGEGVCCQPLPWRSPAEAYHGLFGEMLKAVSPETEAHPAGVLPSVFPGLLPRLYRGARGLGSGANGHSPSGIVRRHRGQDFFGSQRHELRRGEMGVHQSRCRMGEVCRLPWR